MMSEMEKFWDLASRFEFGMLVTQDAGEMRARPLAVHLDRQARQFHFLTRASDHKVKELQSDKSVCLTLADPSANLYLSISGHAEITQNRELIGKLWDASASAWFDSGPDNPDIAVLTITPTGAEYWEGPASAMAKVWQLASGALGGKPAMGANAKLNP